MGGDGYVVQQAESHGCIRQGMVAWWSNRAECLPVVSLDDSTNRIDRRSGCERCRIPGSARNYRVCFDPPRVLVAPSFELFNIGLAVIRLALLCGGREPARSRRVFDPTARLEHAVDLGDPRDALRMLTRIVFFEDFAVVK